MPRKKEEVVVPDAAEIEQLFADICSARQMERSATARLVAYARANGSASGAGLHCALTQGRFEGVMKPGVAADSIIRFCGGDPAMLLPIIECLLEKIDVRSLNNTIKRMPNGEDIASMISNADQDGGCTNYYGDVTCSIRAAEVGQGKYWHNEVGAELVDGKWVCLWDDGLEHPKGFEQTAAGEVDPDAAAMMEAAGDMDYLSPGD